MRTPILIALAAALTLPAASSAKREILSDEARLEKALTGLTPGKPVSCIDLRNTSGPEAIGDTLLFRTSRKLIYRNEAPGCKGRFDEAFITRTFGGRLCRGDVVSRADLRTGFESGFCIAGTFTPYRATP